MYICTHSYPYIYICIYTLEPSSTQTQLTRQLEGELTSATGKLHKVEGIYVYVYVGICMYVYIQIDFTYIYRYEYSNTCVHMCRYCLLFPLSERKRDEAVS
jgi:hypothetical protein